MGAYDISNGLAKGLPASQPGYISVTFGYFSVTFGYFSVTFRLYFGYIPLTLDIPFLYKIQSGYNHVNVTCITGYVVTKRDVTEK